MTIDQENNFKLLSDEPILESERGDWLQFEHTAKVLARAALHTDSPITLGVYGNWGSGKTSLMRLMKQIVEKEGVEENSAVAVWFNAWQYEREEHLLVPLIATIARDIKNRQPEWDTAMKGGGKKILDSLRSVLYGVSMKGKLDVPLLGKLEISASMKDIIERYEAVTQDTLMNRSLYFNAFDDLRKLSHDKKVKKPQIIVFIDDLDRCFPEQAVRLLESIKLVLHQPNFAFVLGIYPQIIEEFIRNKYAAQYPMAAARAAARNDDEFNGGMEKYLSYFNDYLGKIVQIRHDVPERHPKQMQKYILNLLEDAGVDSEFLVEGVSREDLLELIAEVGKRSPREIVRKINGLIVKWRITRREKGEEETFDLLAGLINETILDRISKSRYVYMQFLNMLGWKVGKDKKQTFGQILSLALKKTPSAANHLEKMNKLKALNVEKSHTMNSLIEILEKDEHLSNVLNSGPGRRWLSDEKYREEMDETYKEKEDHHKATLEAVEEGMVVPLRIREYEAQTQEDIEHILPGLRWVEIPAGTFDMGSEEGNEDEKPIHSVKLDSFRMSATPVTQRQYENVMGVNPSEFRGKGRRDTTNHPVEKVSWKDAMVFCEQLTKLIKENGRVMLPTEAQWEYACRGGKKDETYDKLDKIAWYKSNSEGSTQEVRTKTANKYGLYDMLGNVWEWCADWYGEKYYAECQKQGAVENPMGPETGSHRVLRGGGWDSGGRYCRCAYRYDTYPGLRYDYIGFRVVVVPE